MNMKMFRFGVIFYVLLSAIIGLTAMSTVISGKPLIEECGHALSFFGMAYAMFLFGIVSRPRLENGNYGKEFVEVTEKLYREYNRRFTVTVLWLRCRLLPAIAGKIRRRWNRLFDRRTPIYTGAGGRRIHAIFLEMQAERAVADRLDASEAQAIAACNRDSDQQQLDAVDAKEREQERKEEEAERQDWIRDQEYQFNRDDQHRRDIESGDYDKHLVQ